MGPEINWNQFAVFKLEAAKFRIATSRKNFQLLTHRKSSHQRKSESGYIHADMYGHPESQIVRGILVKPIRLGEYP